MFLALNVQGKELKNLEIKMKRQEQHKHLVWYHQNLRLPVLTCTTVN